MREQGCRRGGDADTATAFVFRTGVCDQFFVERQVVDVDGDAGTECLLEGGPALPEPADQVEDALGLRLYVGDRGLMEQIRPQQGVVHIQDEGRRRGAAKTTDLDPCRAAWSVCKEVMLDVRQYVQRLTYDEVRAASNVKTD